ncbi:hypothetical protein BHE74_00030732 [Ensete ventricosum]|nr:hypothetical protein GW17_00033686 [Ensete ventricosum]RWW62162.1 hypothetical protein BHE74_00030732 [Ensete ventricosum]RZS08069.1 hypothetical protein BHM03_00039005 [Ensete ventricosum]
MVGGNGAPKPVLPIYPSDSSKPTHLRLKWFGSVRVVWVRSTGLALEGGSKESKRSNGGYGFQDDDAMPVFLQNLMIGTPCFRGYGRRNGERRRKSVRGCIVSPDLSVLNLVIVKKGENDLPGLTDIEKPRMRGPKRASKIRKLFNLSKEDDVRKYVNTYRRTFTTKSEKKKRIAKAKSEAAEYQKLLATRLKEQRERRSESLAKRRSKLSAVSKPSIAA